MRIRERLAPGLWSRELVIGEVKFQREVELIREQGITLHSLVAVLTELKRPGDVIEGGAGGHLVDLVTLTAGSVVAGGGN